MSNHPTETRLALYFSDDLPGEECRSVEAHVQVCSTCRQIVLEFGRSRELLQRVPAEPAAEQLSELRCAVLSRVAERHSSGALWKWCLGSAAAIVSIALLSVHRAPSVHVPPAASAAPMAARHIPSETPIHVPSQAMRVSRKLHHRATSGLRSVELIARGDEAPLIKMTTADPNVVILLQTERTANYE